MLSILKGPYLQWPSPNSVIVMWETSGPSTSQVTFCGTERVPQGLDGRFKSLPETARVLEDSTPREIHAVTLDGLDPETTYHYAVESTNTQGESIRSEEHPLKTAVAPATPFSFAVTSETGGYGNDDFNRRIFAQIQGYRPDFLLVVGDSVASGSRYADWDRYFFTPGTELFHHTPFYLCPGNHEENAPWFYRFVSYPKPGNFYSFTYGNTLFVALDSTKTDELQPGQRQFEFLDQTLASCSATWKIVFFHYPPYVSADYQVDETRALCPLFDKHCVDLVFNSHTIVYERSHPLRSGRLDLDSGVTYVVAGGAGQAPQWWHHKRAWHTAQALAVPHFVQVVVAGPTLELRAVDLDGRHFDHLSLRKSGV